MKLNRRSPVPEKRKPGRPKGAPTTAETYKKGKYIKVKRFVEEYLVDLSAFKAYKRCGYSSGNDQLDRQMSSRLFLRDDVQQLINEEQYKISRATGITQDKIIKELATIAFANIDDIAEWDGKEFKLKTFDELTRDKTAIIYGVQAKNNRLKFISEVKFSTPSASDKRAALVDIGRHIGMWKEGSKTDDPYDLARKTKKALEEIEEKTNGNSESKNS